MVAKNDSQENKSIWGKKTAPEPKSVTGAINVLYS